MTDITTDPMLDEPDDLLEDETPAEDGVPIPEGASALEGLRRARARNAAGDREAWFDIPGYGGKLVGLFRAQSFETMKTLGQRLGKSRDPRKEINAMADLLAWSCQSFAVIGSNGRVGVEHAIGDPDGGPVRFDKRLGQALDFPRLPRTARDAVFLAIPDEVAVVAFHNEVAGWMQDLDAGDDGDADELFVGESNARP